MSKKEFALITGASSGIGYELVKIIAKAGNNVILVARNEKKLIELKKEIEKESKVEVIVMSADLTVPGMIDKIYSSVARRKIFVNILVNDAGFGSFGNFYESDWKIEENMIDLNVKALTGLTRLFLSEMVSAKNGKILNVASTAAFQPGPLMANYYASKAYVLSFSEAVYRELKGTGVSVTALCPGPTKTGFQKRAFGNQSANLFRGKVANAYDVALYGYKSMMAGKRVAIHGTRNKFIALLSQIVPRKIVLDVVYKLNK